jgi:hypothetical protein
MPKKQQDRRPRRTLEEMVGLDAAVLEVFKRITPPLTVRGVFYQLVTAKAVVKDEEHGYRDTKRWSLKMRRDGRIPYEWIADPSRGRRVPLLWDSFDDYRETVRSGFVIDPWQYQPRRVEVLVEKEALVGVLEKTTSKYRVPLLSGRGYNSETALYNLAEIIGKRERPTVLLLLGDHDPSGQDIIRDNIGRLQRFTGGNNIETEMLALTQEQVEEYDLPTRPPKPKDSRTKRWEGKGAVELDALNPDVLRQIVREGIERHIDWDHWQECLDAEKRIQSKVTKLLE